MRRVVGAAELHGYSRSAAHRRVRRVARAGARRARRGTARSARRSTASSAVLYAGYRDELDRLERWDRGLLRSHSVERLRADLDAWHGEPVFAYGFEDLTGAEWSLLEALAARTEVTVSLPYEPGRPAFAALRRTAEDLAGLAEGVEELPANYAAVAPPALAHLERTLFARPAAETRRRSDGVVRFFEGAGSRGTLELVAEEVLALVARRHVARADRDRRARLRAARRARSRRCSAPRGSLRNRRRAPAHADPARARARRRCCASPGQEGHGASSSASSARRSRGSSGGRSTSSRAGCAGARFRRRSGWSKRPSACATEPRCRRSPSCERRPIRSRRCASSRSGCCATPTALERPPADAASRVDLRAYEALRRLLGRARELARADRRR